MLTIRMRRMGAKKRPFFRVVVTEARSAASGGRSLEVLGHYDPASQPETLKLNRERLQHWLTRGAQPSDTVRTMLARHPEEAEDGGAATPPPVVEETPEAPLAATEPEGS